MKHIGKPCRPWQLWKKRLKGCIGRKPVLALGGYEGTVVDLKTGAGKGNVRPASVANLQLANLLICPLVEQGLKAQTQTWGEPPQLQADVASFLQGSSEMTEEKSKEISLEPPISQPAEWVRWKAERCDVPDWWAELSTVPLEDIEKLARQVRASFKLPKHMHELDPEEAPFHAPPAPPCLH